MTESGGSTPSTETPLATRSGLRTPATRPLPLRAESSPERTSADPTVSTCGRKPGSLTSSATLPAATTTLTPASCTAATASVSGSEP